MNVKQKIKEQITANLKSIKGIVSITFVGSFVNQKDLSGISDIDTVVVCKKLDRSTFQSCMNNLKTIDLKLIGLKDHQLKINSTFGPLKFDKKNLVVIHLMIYDYELHKAHVLKSPFTCFSWEKGETWYGQRIRNIYPVGSLQLKDFFEARRSLKNYFDDLSKNQISYREYNFSKKKVSEIKKFFQMDNRHQGEFSYHLAYHLISNYLNFYLKKNKYYSPKKITIEIKRLFINNGTKHSKKFKQISQVKTQRDSPFPRDCIGWSKNFISDFQKSIIFEWQNSSKVIFMRHFQTKLNDGSFLGQGRDPGISDNNFNPKISSEFDFVYCSSMLRCKETAKILFPKNSLLEDNRLLEINYGKAEGLSYNQFKKKFPDIISAWNQQKDPSFPNGENMRNVKMRLNNFLYDLKLKLTDSKDKKNTFIITHNGILRCLIGQFFNLNESIWHKINIPHAKNFEFLFWRGEFYPNLSRVTLANILKNIVLF